MISLCEIWGSEEMNILLENEAYEDENNGMSSAIGYKFK